MDDQRILSGIPDGDRFFHFAAVFIWALGPTQSHAQRVPVTLSQGLSSLCMQVTTHIHLVLKDKKVQTYNSTTLYVKPEMMFY